MIRKNKWWILISVAVTLLPSLLVPLLHSALEAHASEAFGSTPHELLRIVPLFPLGFLLLHLLCIFITAWDHRGREQTDAAFRMVLFLCPTLSLFIAGIFTASAIGYRIHYNAVTALLFGGLLLLIGNYMPKCMQNRTIGIKLPWTLQSESNWYKTHRFGGKVFMLLGAGILISAALPFQIFFSVLLISVLLAVIAPTVYSYLYYKKELREGSLPAKGNAEATRKYRRTTSIAIVFLVIVLSAVLFIAFSGGYEITMTADTLSVDANFSKDLTIEYSDITEIELYPSGIPGERIFGYGAPNLLMGTFQNSEIGFHTRYTYTASNACILLTVGENSVVLSGKTDTETQALYDALTELLKAREGTS